MLMTSTADVLHRCEVFSIKRWLCLCERWVYLAVISLSTGLLLQNGFSLYSYNCVYTSGSCSYSLRLFSLPLSCIHWKHTHTVTNLEPDILRCKSWVRSLHWKLFGIKLDRGVLINQCTQLTCPIRQHNHKQSRSSCFHFSIHLEDANNPRCAEVLKGLYL